MHDAEKDIVDQSTAAARNVVEERMRQWGFTPEDKAIWNHLVNNIALGIQLELSVGEEGIDRLKEAVVTPLDDLTFLPEKARQMAAAYKQGYPNDEKIETAMKPVLEGTAYTTAYALEKAMTDALHRAGARAALHIFDRQSQRQQR